MEILTKGSTAPDFDVVNADGHAAPISATKNAKNLLIHFFPKAKTSGCEQELCSIRDNIKDLSDSNVSVIAISCDSMEDLRAWQEEQNLKFAFVSDASPRGEISKKYGAYNEELNIANRASFLIDTTGVIVWSQQVDLGSIRSINDYKEAIKLLA
jgi:peroxiredoxin